jgi:putative transposase
MARKPRSAPGGLVYHVLNRSVGRLPLFRKEADYAAFERILHEAQQRHPTRILAWCLMRNHWHLALWPRKDGELTAFVRWLSLTHAMRWHVSHGTTGGGHLYQGRFKSFPIQEDSHLLTVLRYVERNALSAKVVRRAENWRWGSLWARLEGDEKLRGLLSESPVDRPQPWTDWVNRPLTGPEDESLALSEQRGRPYGDADWRQRQVAKLHLEHTIRSEGRPKKKENPKTGTQLV